MNCENCGAPINEENNGDFCKYCGSKLPKEVEPVTNITNNTTNNTTRNVTINIGKKKEKGTANTTAQSSTPAMPVGKTKKCKKCKMPIPKKASKCPHCGSNQGMGCISAFILAFVIAFIIALVVVNSNQRSNNRTNNSNSSTSTAVSSEETKELLCDYNGMKIYYTGLSEGILTDAEIRISIENDSEVNYTVQIEDFYVNDYQANTLFSKTVNAGKKAETSIDFFFKDIKAEKITDIKTAELSFSIFKEKDFGNSEKTKKITIQFG